jgi:hypothetical protein
MPDAGGLGCGEMVAACRDIKKTSGWSGTCESRATRRSLCSHNAAKRGARKEL